MAKNLEDRPLLHLQLPIPAAVRRREQLVHRGVVPLGAQGPKHLSEFLPGDAARAVAVEAPEGLQDALRHGARRDRPRPGWRALSGALSTRFEAMFELNVMISMRLGA